MNLRCVVEPFSAWRGEAAPLFRAHWEEIARHRDRFALDMDWARYQRMEDAGGLLAVTLRHGWKLAGYAVFFLGTHLHYRAMNVAIPDILYIVPEHRAGGFAYCALIRHCNDEFARRGVHVATLRDKLAHDFGPVYRRVGYAPVERSYEKLF